MTPVELRLLAAFGLIAALWIGYGVWHHQVYQSAFEAGKNAQKTINDKACAADKFITEGASHDYQANLSTLDSSLSDRLRIPVCIPFTPGASFRPNATARAVDDKPHGLPAEVLYQYAGSCEKYRLQVNGLQTFINKTWERKP